MAADSNRLQLLKGKIYRITAAVAGWLIEPSASLNTAERRRVRILSLYFLFGFICLLAGIYVLKNINNIFWIPLTAMTTPLPVDSI